MAEEELIKMQGKVDEVLPDSRFPGRFIVVERLDWRKAIDRFGSRPPVRGYETDGWNMAQSCRCRPRLNEAHAGQKRPIDNSPQAADTSWRVGKVVVAVQHLR